MKKSLCILLLCVLSMGSVAGQDTKGPSKHFATQLLNLEEELGAFREKIDKEEQLIREALARKTSELYALRQKQRSASDMSDEEKAALAEEIRVLAESINTGKTRMREALTTMERKRQDIFALKLSIDQWVAKVKATEDAVVARIENIKSEITQLIKELDQEFDTEAVAPEDKK